MSFSIHYNNIYIEIQNTSSQHTKQENVGHNVGGGYPPPNELYVNITDVITWYTISNFVLMMLSRNV